MNELAERYNGPSDEAIRAALAPFGFDASTELTAGIRRHVELLKRWNQRISLTSIEDTGEILQRHFGESFFAVRAVPIVQGRLADVGSGAGFPGLPIKLASPQMDLTLIESNTRKAAFLSEAIRRLGLTGVTVLNKRMEEIEGLVDTLDFVTARALGGMDKLLKWSQSSLRAGGRLVLWLGAKHTKEVSLAPGWTWCAPILIPGSQSRVLVIGEKN